MFAGVQVERRPNDVYHSVKAAVGVVFKGFASLRRAYMARKNVFVGPHPDGWAVKKQGNERASSVHPTKKEAVDAGRDAAKVEKSELVIRGRDGKIQDKDSFGPDPFPPKDNKH